MDSCARKIIKDMSALDGADDGIKANQKFKHILSIFEEQCTTAEHLREIYKCLNEQSLKDSKFAQKFALLSASRLFQTVELFGQKATSLMMGVMKENYENLDNIKETDLDGFYNSVVLFGEYFNRARTPDGSSLSYLVIPLIECFNVMLQLNTERSAKEFVAQLSLNGPVMYKTHPEQVFNLMITVRKSIFSPDRENDNASMWLLLCLDLSQNQFRELDPRLGQFYTDLLEGNESKKQKTKSGSELKKHDTVEPENEEGAGQESHKKDVAEKEGNNVSGLGERLTNVQLSQHAQEESQKVIQADVSENEGTDSKEYRSASVNRVKNVQQSQIVQQEFQKIIQVDVTDKEGNSSNESRNKENRLTNVQLSRPSTNTSHNIPQPTKTSSNINTNLGTLKNSQENIGRSASSDKWDLDDSTTSKENPNKSRLSNRLTNIQLSRPPVNISQYISSNANTNPGTFKNSRENMERSASSNTRDIEDSTRSRESHNASILSNRLTNIKQNLPPVNIGYDIPQQTNTSSNMNTNSGMSRKSCENIEKSASSDTWDVEDSPTRQIPLHRSKSMVKTTATRPICRETSYSNENVMRRSISPVRFSNRSNNDNMSRSFKERDESPPTFDRSRSDRHSGGFERHDQPDRYNDYSEGYTKQDPTPPRFDTRSRNDKYSGGFEKRDQHDDKYKSDDYSGGSSKRDASPPRFNVRSRNENYSGGYTKRDTRPRSDNYSGGYEKRDSSRPRSGNWSKSDNYSEGYTKRDTSPPRFDVRTKNENYSGGYDKRDGYDSRARKENNFRNYSQRDTSPPRFDTRSRNENVPKYDTRFCQDTVIKSVESNEKSEYVTPRERIQRVLSPHQASYEKAQRLNRKASTNEYDNTRNDTQESRNNFSRTNSQNKKASKAYLQDHNVENLTWNNSDYYKEIHSERNEGSPRFLDYLQRN